MNCIGKSATSQIWKIARLTSAFSTTQWQKPQIGLTRSEHAQQPVKTAAITKQKDLQCVKVMAQYHLTIGHQAKVQAEKNQNSADRHSSSFHT